jgi:hypothetical protein
VGPWGGNRAPAKEGTSKEGFQEEGTFELGLGMGYVNLRYQGIIEGGHCHLPSRRGASRHWGVLVKNLVLQVTGKYRLPPP